MDLRRAAPFVAAAVLAVAASPASAQSQPPWVDTAVWHSQNIDDTARCFSAALTECNRHFGNCGREGSYLIGSDQSVEVAVQCVTSLGDTIGLLTVGADRSDPRASDRARAVLDAFKATFSAL